MSKNDLKERLTTWIFQPDNVVSVTKIDKRVTNQTVKYSYFSHRVLLFLTEYNQIGCFRTDSGPAIKSLENNDPVLDGDYTTRENSVLKCLNAARRKGNKMFALNNGGECLSSAGGHLDVETAYEEADECVNDKGGVNAMDVYIITGTLQFQGFDVARNISPGGYNLLIQPRH